MPSRSGTTSSSDTSAESRSHSYNGSHPSGLSGVKA